MVAPAVVSVAASLQRLSATAIKASLLYFSAYLKTPSTTFRYPSNLLHLRNALLFHPKISKSAPSAQPQLFIIHFSSFIIHYLRRQPRQPHHHRHPTLSITSHRPISNSRHRRNHNYSLFIFHHSSFIIFAANPAIPTITATLHYPSPRTIKNQNPRRR